MTWRCEEEEEELALLACDDADTDDGPTVDEESRLGDVRASKDFAFVGGVVGGRTTPSAAPVDDKDVDGEMALANEAPDEGADGGLSDEGTGISIS